MEIGGSLQAGMVSIAIAACAFEKGGSDLGPKFLEVVKAGNAMRSLNRNTLFHNPNAGLILVPLVRAAYRNKPPSPFPTQ